MITLHIAKYLETLGLGTFDVAGTIKTNGIYTEFLDTGKTGITIYSRGAALSRGTRTTQAFDLYARGTNNIDGYKKLEQAIKTLQDNYNDQCSLPTPIMLGIQTLSDKQYTNIVIEPISGVENVGADATNRVIYSATFTIKFDNN